MTLTKENKIWQELPGEETPLTFTSRPTNGPRQVAVIREKSTERLLAVLPMILSENDFSPKAIVNLKNGGLGRMVLRAGRDQFIGIRESDGENLAKQYDPISSPTNLQYGIKIDVQEEGEGDTSETCSIWWVNGKKLEVTITDHGRPENPWETVE